MSKWVHPLRVLALAGAILGPTAAVADDASEPGAEATLQEVIVTSQRRETEVQTTAAAVSAYSAADLEMHSATSVESLSTLNPSVLVSLFQGEAQIYIRGIGYSSVVGGSDSSTAFHSDGVYISRSAGAVPAYMDVQRIEVLRGPQGTLYGRNATGGSVNVITKGPGKELEYEGSLTMGNYDLFRTFAAIGGPISDRVGIRFAAQREKRSGYTHLVRPVADPAGLGAVRDDAEDADSWSARVTLDAQFTDSFRATLKADYYEADDAATVWHYFSPGTSTDPIYQALVPISVRSQPYARTYGSDIGHFNRPKVSGVSAKLEWDLGDVTLTSLTAYRKTHPFNRDDLDLSPVFGVDQLREEDQNQFSQEVQLSSAASGALQWILGGYYFQEKNAIRNEYFLPFTEGLFGLPPDPVCCLLKLNGKTTTDAYAAFGEATYAFNERMQLVLGGRYSSETRGGDNLVVFENAPVTIFDNVAKFDDARFSAFTPKAGLNFTVNDDVFLYVSASKGFKSGGFNPGSYQNDPFRPEKIWAYELGAKLTALDHRLRVNLAAFRYDYTDLQVQDVENNNVTIRNAAEAQVDGLELESAWLVTPALELDANATWLNAEFTDGALLDPKFPQLGIQALDGKQLPRAPKLKAGIGAQYGFKLGAPGDFTLRVDYTWQDKVYFTAFNVADVSEDSYGWLKGRLRYSSPSAGWSIAAFIDNATNEKVATSKIYNGDIIGSTVLGSLAPPRTYGLELKKEVSP